MVPLLNSEASDDLVKDLDFLGSKNVMVEVEVGSNGVRLPLLVTDVAIIVVLSDPVSLLDSTRLLAKVDDSVVIVDTMDSDVPAPVLVAVNFRDSVSLLDSTKLLPDTEEVVVIAESADSDVSTLVLVAITLGDSVVPLDTTELTNIEGILVTSGSLDSDASVVVPAAASVCVTDSSEDLCNPDE